MVYWLDTTVLPPGDPVARRPVVVVAAPESVGGTVAVVSRSGTEGFGVGHPADARLGFSGAGHFSRRHPVSGRLWTSLNVTPIGPLDAAVFAEVVGRFGP